MAQTELGEKLQVAIIEGNYFANGYVWKGEKVRNTDGTFTQETVKLMDATEEQLQRFNKHCNSMLYSQDKENPGRYPLLQIIQLQKDKCGAELYLREAEEGQISRYSIAEAIKHQIRASGVQPNRVKTIPLSEFIEVSSQYQNLPIDLIQDGCLYSLGKFIRNHITLTFIVRQGLKVSESEEAELTEYIVDEKNNQMKLGYAEVAHKKLNLGDHYKLRIDDRGLSFTQLKSMVNLRSNYYDKLGTDQLKTLRYRILFSLEDKVIHHIQQWEQRLQEIVEVANIREIEL